MNITRRRLVPTLATLTLLAAPLGCGTEAPPSTASAPVAQPQVQAGSPEVAESQPIAPQPVVSNSPALEAPVTPDRELRQEGQELRQAAGAIEAQVKDQAARAVGEGRGQVDRAVTETGAQVDSIRDDASKAVDRASGEAREVVDQLKGEVKGVADQATGSIRDAVDQAAGGVKKAVGGAKDEARRRARSIGEGVEKAGKDLKKQVVNDLLGPANN